MNAGLKIAVVHYHLHPGGVTRVMQHAVRSFADQDVQFAMLSGEPTTENFGSAKICVVPGLGYAKPEARESDADLLHRMDEAVREALGGRPDLWHLHNHSMGKNAALPGVVFKLAQRGDRLLLQIHDFPEDGRPSNYRFLLEKLMKEGRTSLDAILYPQASHVHYAVLNDRDLHLLREAGVRAEGLHLLPDPVSLDVTPNLPEKPTDGAEALHLYPTRGIRRKNLGEFLFWSALAQPHERFAATLAPKNPREIPIYDRWVEFAARHHLPVRFNVGADPSVSFVSLLQSAQDIVTTSVAEGFGLAFLEPWLAGRAVVGRDLPEITRSFRDAGVNMSELYERLEIPLHWVGRDELREHVSSTLTRSREQYGRRTTDHDIERAFSAMVKNDRVDFGRLDEALQEKVIERVVASEEDRRSLGQKLVSRPVGAEQIRRNREIIEREFSLKSYGTRLTRIYDAVCSAAAGEVSALPEARLLEGFLDPERFFLLRSL
jgi:glycosyltransferase involved in cell wall biosynthesis